MEPAPLPKWEPFELDGRRLVWRAFPIRVKTRPAGWPSHKPSPGTSKPAVMIEVRRA